MTDMRVFFYLVVDGKRYNQKEILESLALNEKPSEAIPALDYSIRLLAEEFAESLKKADE